VELTKNIKHIALLWLILAVILQGLSGAAFAAPAQGGGEIVILTVDGPIVPAVASYLERGIALAEREKAAACVIQLSTPGGLYQSTQEIVGHILNARVPVVVYVSPQGGWAGSAGTFITVAAHYAAMAPGSRIGAAHPVSVAPGPEEKQVSPAKKLPRTRRPGFAPWPSCAGETPMRRSWPSGKANPIPTRKRWSKS
jgi:Nodulation efficiency protein NfeD